MLQRIKTSIFNFLSTHTKAWVSKLPNILWALRTTSSRATGETPFLLVYRAEAMLPYELNIKSRQVELYIDKVEITRRHDDLIVLKEKRTQVLIRSTRYLEAL